MTRVVINKCYGGFGLSEAGVRKYFEILGQPVWVEKDGVLNIYWKVPPEQRQERKEGEAWYEMSIEERQAYNIRWRQEVFYDRDLQRDDPILVKVVEELGEDAYGMFAELKIVEIPDNVEWEIAEYDGMEWVAEVHRTWS